MVIMLSYLIAVIITVVLAIVLYPISAIFYVVGKIGYVLGKLADFIFSRTNSAIRKLWADIKNTKIVRDGGETNTETAVEYENNNYVENEVKS